MKFNKDSFNMKRLLKKVGKKAKDESEEDQNILGKVGSFFDPEPQKERVLSKEDFNGTGDVYYATVSAFYKIAERLLWVILAVFLSFSIATNYREITYSNFFYLLRDFSTAAESNTSNYQVLSYDSDERQKFSIYRGGLVSASPSSISIFTASGRRTLKSNNDYYSPNVICCDKYVLVYDGARSAFSIYNSFSKVYNGKTDAPITDACFNSDGAFAVATRKESGGTVIYLYDEDIKERGKISDSRYMFDMALNDSQSRFATLYYSAGNGTGETAVCVYDIISSGGQKLSNVLLQGEFPLRCSFIEGGGLVVITDRSIRVYDDDFKQVSEQSFGEAKICAFDANENGAIAVVSKGSERNVYAYDSDGDELFDGAVSENVSSAAVYGDYLFLGTVSGVIRIDSSDGEREFLPSENGKMLVYSEDTAIVCGDAKAEYLVFDN